MAEGRGGLDARLGALLELIGPAETVADIGADHGHLALALLRADPARRVLLSDISEASLSKARRLFAGEPERGRATFVVADGLDALAGWETPQAIALAGMGAGLMQEILTRGEALIGQTLLCLVPNRDVHFLREWLQEHGFALQAERVVRAAGRLYVGISARRGVPTAYTEMELFLGPLLLREDPPLFRPYLSWRRDVLRHALRGLERSAVPTAGDRAREARRQIAWIEEALA